MYLRQPQLRPAEGYVSIMQHDISALGSLPVLFSLPIRHKIKFADVYLSLERLPFPNCILVRKVCELHPPGPGHSALVPVSLSSPSVLWPWRTTYGCVVQRGKASICLDSVCVMCREQSWNVYHSNMVGLTVTLAYKEWNLKGHVTPHTRQLIREQAVVWTQASWLHCCFLWN